MATLHFTSSRSIYSLIQGFFLVGKVSEFMFKNSSEGGLIMMKLSSTLS